MSQGVLEKSSHLVRNSTPGGEVFSNNDKIALKERLRPIVSETLAKLHSSSVPLEERIQVLKKMLSVELPQHVSSHILDENFDSHARQLFLHQHPFENDATSNDVFKVVSTPDATVVKSNSLEVSNDDTEVD